MPNVAMPNELGFKRFLIGNYEKNKDDPWYQTAAGQKAIPIMQGYKDYIQFRTNPNSSTTSATATGGSGGYSSGGMAGAGDNPLTPLILDPNWGPAVYDTEKRGAELAVAGGYSGSPLAGYQTARMRAADIERRAALGNSLLSGQTDRQLGVQGQANQVSQFGQSFAESQRQFNEQQRLAREKFDWEQQQKNLATQAAAGYRYQSGRGAYSPLPQYLNVGGGNSYTITPWGPDQSGPTGRTDRYRY